jgi:hypothetical protein
LTDEYIQIGMETKYESDGTAWVGLVYQHSVTGDKVIWWTKALPERQLN